MGRERSEESEKAFFLKLRAGKKPTKIFLFRNKGFLLPLYMLQHHFTVCPKHAVKERSSVPVGGEKKKTAEE